ncbi:hypothetical protein MBANPS3_002867 [Mucor bainieri]
MNLRQLTEEQAEKTAATTTAIQTTFTPDARAAMNLNEIKFVELDYECEDMESKMDSISGGIKTLLKRKLVALKNLMR